MLSATRDPCAVARRQRLWEAPKDLMRTECAAPAPHRHATLLVVVDGCRPPLRLPAAAVAVAAFRVAARQPQEVPQPRQALLLAHGKVHGRAGVVGVRASWRQRGAAQPGQILPPRKRRCACWARCCVHPGQLHRNGGQQAGLCGCSSQGCRQRRQHHAAAPAASWARCRKRRSYWCMGLQRSSEVAHDLRQAGKAPSLAVWAAAGATILALRRSWRGRCSRPAGSVRAAALAAFGGVIVRLPERVGQVVRVVQGAPPVVVHAGLQPCSVGRHSMAIGSSGTAGRGQRPGAWLPRQLRALQPPNADRSFHVINCRLQQKAVPVPEAICPPAPYPWPLFSRAPGLYRARSPCCAAAAANAAATASSRPADAAPGCK